MARDLSGSRVWNAIMKHDAVLPDATYGTCQIHAPAEGAIVRLVDENGEPHENGLCEFCFLEENDAEYFKCEVHGLNRKAAGKTGCPFPGCLGKGPRPTEDEIERAAESIGRIWPGGPPIEQAHVVPEAAGPAVERGDQAGAGVERGAGDDAEHDRRGVEDDAAGRDRVPLVIDGLDQFLRPHAGLNYVVGIDPAVDDDEWTDPFLEP